MLADRNHFVLGIDRSESMINIAARNSSRKLVFLRSDIRELNLMRDFDIVIIMFSALGYITNEQDLLQVFQKIGSTSIHPEEYFLMFGMGLLF